VTEKVIGKVTRQVIEEVQLEVLASSLAFPESPVVEADGSVLVSEVAAGRVSRVLPGGTTETVARTGGGPNGVAPCGGRLVVCQNGGSRWGIGPWPYDLPGAVQLFRPVGPPDEPVTPQVQAVDAAGAVTTLAVGFTGLDGEVRPFVRPSDVCADGADGFYMTDGGTTVGRSRQVTGLLHGTPDGTVRELVFPLEMPNGVALDPTGTWLYVAETRTRRIWQFTVTEPGVLGGGRGFATVPSGGPLDIGGADGICVDPSGCVVVATLGAGGITVFDPDGTLVLQVPADDPMTTNVAIDPVRDRLVVTLASTGRLAVLDGWRALLGAVLG
jgi:gluconolactonase